MVISPKEFKEEFNHRILEIHWRHWTALGVESYVEPEMSWLIDLEPLTLSTLVAGLDDKRLLSSAIEWLTVNNRWLNTSRLRTLAKLFTSPVKGMDEPLLDKTEFTAIVDFIRQFPRNRPGYLTDNHHAIREGSQLLETFRIRGVASKPKIQQPALFQLHLRAVFGISAHVEVFTYLLLSEGGNSNSIANEVHHDQKNVYRILERWAEAGILSKFHKGKANDYRLMDKNRWIQALGISQAPKYINWGKVFLLLDTTRKILSTKPWRDDDYLISSFFRDIHSNLIPIGRSTTGALPDPDYYPGNEFFSPFAHTMLELVNQLSSYSYPIQRE